MATCKECVHYDVCYFIETYGADDIEICNQFKNKESFVERPCKVGDSCYPLPRYKGDITERKVSRITYSARNIIIGYYENDGQYRPPLRTRILGEDVFLTKEDAERAAKERIENENGNTK